jgi:hypothetical protein
MSSTCPPDYDPFFFFVLCAEWFDWFGKWESSPLVITALMHGRALGAKAVLAAGVESKKQPQRSDNYDDTDLMLKSGHQKAGFPCPSGAGR